MSRCIALNCRKNHWKWNTTRCVDTCVSKPICPKRIYFNRLSGEFSESLLMVIPEPWNRVRLRDQELRILLNIFAVRHLAKNDRVIIDLLGMLFLIYTYTQIHTQADMTQMGEIAALEYISNFNDTLHYFWRE